MEDFYANLTWPESHLLPGQNKSKKSSAYYVYQGTATMTRKVSCITQIYHILLSKPLLNYPFDWRPLFSKSDCCGKTSIFWANLGLGSISPFFVNPANAGAWTRRTVLHLHRQWQSIYIGCIYHWFSFRSIADYCINAPSCTSMFMSRILLRGHPLFRSLPVPGSRES